MHTNEGLYHVITFVDFEEILSDLGTPHSHASHKLLQDLPLVVVKFVKC